MVSYREGYFSGEIFSAKHAIDKWKAKLTEALSRGYDGIRAHGNEAWLTEEYWKNFLDYEKSLKEIVAGQRMLILCAYPLATRTAAEVFDVAQAHDFATARRQGKWEVFETPEIKATKAELTRLKEELERRVQDRTKQLATINEQLKEEIAQRIVADRELRQSERKFRDFLELAPAGVWTCDVSGRITYYNKRAVGLFGFEPALWTPLPQFCMTPKRFDADGNALPPFDSSVIQAMQTGKPINNKELILERPDHSRITVLASVAVMRDEQNQIIGAIRISFVIRVL